MRLKQDKMDSIKIIEEKENYLFKRKEILAEVNAHKVPSKDEVSELIAKKLSANKETIVIERIKGKFGASLFMVSAKIYQTAQDKDKIEPKSKKDKKNASLASNQSKAEASKKEGEN